MNNINQSDSTNKPCPNGTKCKKCNKVLMKYYNYIWDTGNDDTYYVKCTSGKCGHNNEFHFKK